MANALVANGFSGERVDGRMIDKAIRAKLNGEWRIPKGELRICKWRKRRTPKIFDRKKNNEMQMWRKEKEISRVRSNNAASVNIE